MKTNDRTKKEIAAEIKALEACKGYIPPQTSFGDDNFKILDLQIEYLRFGIDTTADEWNDYSADEQSNILDAQAWQEGQADESPSSGWDNYKPNKRKEV